MRKAGVGGLGILGASLTRPLAVAASGSRLRSSGTVRPAELTSAATARLGVFAEPDGTETGYFDAFKKFQNMIGRAVDIYRTYRSWGQPLFNSTIRNIYDPQKNPRTPPQLYVSFHAFLDSKGNDCVPWVDIARGEQDAVIDSWASELKQLQQMGRTHHYVCFHHEMENEKGLPPEGSGTPLQFQKAYWYFRRRIEVVNGVSDLTWVVTYMHNTFAPYLKHGGPDKWWPATSPYADVPNDHLVGVDIYNRNLCHYKEWRTFKDLVDPVLESPTEQALTAYRFSVGKERNLFIGECGCVEGDACGGGLPYGTAKAQWFDDALTEMQGWSNLEAFCYSHVTGFNSGGYRIDTSPEAQAAFTTLANDPLFA
jgi:hypothetical protein